MPTPGRARSPLQRPPTQRAASLQPNEANLQDPGSLGIRFWIPVIFTGLLSGLAGIGLMKLLQLAEHLTWLYGTGTFLDAVRRTSVLHRVLALTLAGALVGVGRLLLKQHARGHGGDLSAAVWLRSGRLSFWATILRSMLSIVVVGMGATVGREGALKQTGASFASILGERFRLSSAQQRVLTVCGAAGGFAAAYNIPFGAAMFGLEVLLGTLSLELIPPITIATLIATGISRLVLPNEPTYHIPHYLADSSLFVWACLAGPLLGVASAGYVKAFAWLDHLRPKRRGAVAFPWAVMISLGVVSIWFPQLLGNGKDTVQEALVGHYSVGLLLALAALKPLLTGLSLGSGIPGGIMTPTLCFGALLSGALAHGWLHLWPGTDEGAFVLLGMGTVLAGATHGPLSTIILIAELTGDAHLTAPLIVSSSLATVVARAIERRSIYTARLHAEVASATTLPKLPPGTAFEHRLDTTLPVVTTAARLASVGRLLLLNDFVLVVDDEGRPSGVIDRSSPGKLERLGMPDQVLTAADVMRPTASPLASDLSGAELERRFAAMKEVPVLVVDAASRRLLGVLALRQEDA